jgi:hypothetical protein
MQDNAPRRQYPLRAKQDTMAALFRVRGFCWPPPGTSSTHELSCQGTRLNCGRERNTYRCDCWKGFPPGLAIGGRRKGSPTRPEAANRCLVASFSCDGRVLDGWFHFPLWLGVEQIVRDSRRNNTWTQGPNDSDQKARRRSRRAGQGPPGNHRGRKKSPFFLDRYLS